MGGSLYLKKSLNISLHHCHIIKQLIPSSLERACFWGNVGHMYCTVNSLLSYPIMLLNGSQGIIRQYCTAHAQCSNYREAERARMHVWQESAERVEVSATHIRHHKSFTTSLESLCNKVQ